jgi:transaldolase
MEIYIDSGELSEIKEAVETGLINGVTTNPSLVQKAGSVSGVEFPTLIKSIVKLLKENCKTDFTVSAEVMSKDSKGMVEEGIKLSKIDKHVIIKVPLTKEGLIAVAKLKEKGIRTNVTLCFTANQALLAAKAGAYIISPFVGRLDDVGQDGIELVSEIRQLYDNYGFKTKIIAASIRTTLHVKQAALEGADIATIPYKIFNQMFNHPLTDKGIEMFNKDWESYQNAIRK